MANIIPVITLKNGVRIANMSSPHPFKFTTGEVLPACSDEVARELKLDAKEVEFKGIKGTTDIRLTFSLNMEVMEHLADLHMNEAIDIILVPLPVMQAMKEAGMPIGKCRCIRVADRVTKEIHPDRFCI